MSIFKDHNNNFSSTKLFSVVAYTALSVAVIADIFMHVKMDDTLLYTFLAATIFNRSVNKAIELKYDKS